MPIKITPKTQAKISIVKKGDSEKEIQQKQAVIPIEEPKVEEVKPQEEEKKGIVIRPQGSEEARPQVEEEIIELVEEEPVPEETGPQISIVAQRGPIVAAHHDSIEALTTEELLKDLAEKWEEFRAKPRAKLCRFTIDPMEVAFIEQFIELEKTKDKNTKDLFLKFTSKFENSIQYSEILVKELKEQIKDNLEFDGRIAYAYWEEWKSPSLLQGPDFFTQNLSLFFKELIDEPERKVVAYILPEDTEDFNDWMHWIGRVLETKLPDNVSFMLTDIHEKQEQEDLKLAFPVKIYNAQLNLNIEGLLKGLNDPQDDRPPDEFRDLMTQLVQTPAKDSTTISRLEERLVEITEDKGWPHLRICVHNIVGQKLLEINYHEAAYNKHIQSREIAGSLKDYEERGALAEGLTAESLKGLYPDSIFAQAMACFQIEEYELAGIHFEEAANHHRFTENYLPEILARKLGGMSYQKSNQLEKAWDIYNYALDAGEFLSKEQRQDSPLAEIGNELIELTEPLELTSSRVLVRQRMIELLGSEWEDYLPEDEEESKKEK